MKKKLINVKIFRFIFEYVKVMRSKYYNLKYGSIKYGLFGDDIYRYNLLYAELICLKYAHKIIRKNRNRYFDIDTYMNILQDIEQSIMDDNNFDDEYKDIICCYIHDKKNI
jgi:hypothetical protein